MHASLLCPRRIRRCTSVGGFIEKSKSAAVYSYTFRESPCWGRAGSHRRACCLQRPRLAAPLMKRVSATACKPVPVITSLHQFLFHADEVHSLTADNAFLAPRTINSTSLSEPVRHINRVIKAYIRASQDKESGIVTLDSVQ